MYPKSYKSSSGSFLPHGLEENSVSKLWYSQQHWLALKKGLQLALDMALLATAFQLAFLLRFDFNIPPVEKYNMSVQLPFVVLLQIAALHLVGGHKLIWRLISLDAVYTFSGAAFLSFLPILLFRLILPDPVEQFRVPLSVIFIDTILAFGGALALRVLGRTFSETQKRGKIRTLATHGKKKPVLLIGAGRAGVMAAREIQNSSSELEVKGFVDNDPGAYGSVAQGVKVLGSTKDLPRLVKELSIDHVVITIPHASRKQIKELLRICEDIPVKARILPGFHEILQGKVQISHIRDLQIEDLLGREPVHLDEDQMRIFLAGKSVMVTGAGGSIGSELARQVSHFQPSTLLLVERAECSLFNIERELRESRHELAIVPLLADVGDTKRMRSIFENYRPQVVFHAAAHKHVPMMECNLTEAVKNNALATNTIGKLAGMSGVEVFVLISTDKAVRPRSVMGASKRVAELITQYLNRQFATRYVAVRFGNVIGSNGSVVTIFQEQIRKGGPVTVTHPDMMRYFMTIPEAAQLVLQAGTMGEGGEIFILDMGEPVRILDLARDAIALSGLKPYEDIDIVFTGVRPGEKLFEELQTNAETMTKTRCPKIFIGKIAAYPEQQVSLALKALNSLSKNGQEQELRKFLNKLLPEAQLEICNSRAEQAEISSGLPLQ